MSAASVDYLRRVRAMASDKQDTWDLSSNDVEALRYLLSERDRLANMHAERSNNYDALEAERDAAIARAEAAEMRAESLAEDNRQAAQVLIESIGAPGPESIAKTVARAVAEIDRLKAELASSKKALDICSVVHGHNVKLKAERDAACDERDDKDRLRAELEQAKAEIGRLDTVREAEHAAAYRVADDLAKLREWVDSRPVYTLNALDANKHLEWLARAPPSAKCGVCDGRGWTMEHSRRHRADLSGDGCGSDCPVQEPCPECGTKATTPERGHLDRALRHWPSKEARAELAALRAVAKAARERLVHGHYSPCPAERRNPRPCLCGHDQVGEALERLDAITSGEGGGR